MREVPTAVRSREFVASDGGGEEVPHIGHASAIESLGGVGEVSDGTVVGVESEKLNGSVGVSPDSDVDCFEVERTRVRCPGGVTA